MKILLTISILLWTISISNHRSEIKYEVCEHTLVDKINMWSQTITELTIPKEQFAKYCMIVFWCESGLNKYSKNGAQQSLFQMTSKTRIALGIPDLQDCTEEELLDYYYVYLKATKKLHLVKTCLDLHVLNAAPSRFHYNNLLTVRGALRFIDYDKNNIITKQDLLRFQEKRCKESRFIQLLILNK